MTEGNEIPMRTRTKLGVTLTAGAMAVLGLAGPTSASTELESTIAAQAQKAGLSKGETAELQQQIDKQLVTTKGGKQIGVNQIAWRDGKVVMTFPLPGEKAARAVNEPIGTLGTPNCSFLWTCLYEHANFDGRRLTWSDCNFENLAQCRGVEEVGCLSSDSGRLIVTGTCERDLR